MRTIKGQNFPQDGNDLIFPDGQIRNETPTDTGTPVVRELYGDIIVNIYKILRYAGIQPNELEDSEVSGYQLLNALKKFANELNDIQQVLTVHALNITALFNFDHLPDNYVFIGKITEDVLPGLNYTIKGSGDDEFPLVSPVIIQASSLVLVTLNEAGCSIAQLNQVSTLADKYLGTPFGTPLSSNSSNKMLYYADGVLFDDNPKSYLIKNRIQTYSSNLNLEICQVIFHRKHLICLTIDTVTFEYKIYCFEQGDFNTVVGESNIAVDNSVNNFPYMYSDSSFVYFSNSTDELNGSNDDFSFGKFLFNIGTLAMQYAGGFGVENSFQKTTNAFISEDMIYTFISGELNSYKFGTDNVEFLGLFNTIDGVVFKFNGSTYYSNGEIAAKWGY